MRSHSALPAALALALAACADGAAPPTSPDLGAAEAPVISEYLAQINDSLAALGAPFRAERAEYVVARGGASTSHQVVFAADRQLRLASRWVPGDIRRAADGNRLTWASFLHFMNANGAGTHTADGNATASVDAAFETWDALGCAPIDLVRRTLPANVNPSVMLGIDGFVNDPFAADISTMGYLPGALFDAVLGPGASQNVLGVTFTYIFGTNTPGGFVPTDVDGNGLDDTALKEIWYNNAFPWTLTGEGNAIDVETVALHENGHALELGHFGRIWGDLKRLKINVAPRAVMNAVILGTLRTTLGTDNAAFCGVFEEWPG